MPFHQMVKGSLLERVPKHNITFQDFNPDVMSTLHGTLRPCLDNLEIKFFFGGQLEASFGQSIERSALHNLTK
jgi:hypothetical protein